MFRQQPMAMEEAVPVDAPVDNEDRLVYMLIKTVGINFGFS